MTIWKFPLAITDRQTIVMPAHAKILTVQGQGEFDAPVLWALVDPASPKIDRNIVMYGTGNPTPSYAGEYVGTVQTYGGKLVWHVFDFGANDIRNN